MVWSYAASPGSQGASLVPSASDGLCRSWLDQALLLPLSWSILGPRTRDPGPSHLSGVHVPCCSFLAGQSGAVTSPLASMGTFPRLPVWPSGHLPSVPSFPVHTPKETTDTRCHVCDFAPHFIEKNVPSSLLSWITSFLRSIKITYTVPTSLNPWPLEQGGELLPWAPKTQHTSGIPRVALDNLCAPLSLSFLPDRMGATTQAQRFLEIHWEHRLMRENPLVQGLAHSRSTGRILVPLGRQRIVGSSCARNHHCLFH